MIAFEVPGEPVAFARAGSNSGRRFTPPKQAAYAEIVQTIARRAMSKAGAEMFTGPVSMSVRAEYACPPSWSKREKESAFWKTSRPDADNILKLAKDALTGIVYRDDALVVEATVQKQYGPMPRMVVVVSQETNG